MEKRLTLPSEKWPQDEGRLETGIKLLVDDEEENVGNKKRRGKPDLLAHRRKKREAQVFYLR